MADKRRGAAAHGDYIFGWQGDALQRAMDNKCNLNQPCAKANLTTQPSSKYIGCNVAQAAPEQVDGCKWTFHPIAIIRASI